MKRSLNLMSAAAILLALLCLTQPENPVNAPDKFESEQSGYSGPEGMPASPEYFTFEQPDGTTFSARMVGSEHYHFMETRTGYTVDHNNATGYYEYLLTDTEGKFIRSGLRAGIDRPKAMGIAKGVREREEVVREKVRQRLERISTAMPPEGAQGVSTTGTVKKLVILANFSDTSITYSQANFNGLFNTPGFSSYGAQGSVWDYYNEASYGALNLETTVSVWVTLPNTMAYYGANDIYGNDVRPREMINDAITALDATGFDFSPFDTDGDTVIDAFAVIHQGRGEEAGGGVNTIWSHKWSITPRLVDGIWLYTYYTAPEKYGSLISTIGVYCHEFGHTLGLPDLYDTGYDSEGAGNWAIMAGGSWNNSGRTPAHFMAWSKAELGWITPTLIDSWQSGLTLGRISDNAAAYKITYGMGSQEYLLIENRQLHGFDASLPGPGLIITRCDDSLSNNNNQSHYMVGVLQADGLWDLDNDVDRGDAGDPFPGSTNNRELNGSTNPSTDSYYNGDTDVSIYDIGNSGATMTFSVGIGSMPSGNLTVTINPADARSAGAQWRRVGQTTWRNSGYIETGLAVGDVTVEFKDVTGWDTPSDETGTISNGVTTSLGGTYVRQTGSLTVTIEPQGARDAGAQWRRTGTSTWNNSGATESGIPTGQVTIEYKDVDGYDPPVNGGATITDGGTATVTATYPLATGSLTVTISPSEAVSAGAQWRRTGTTTWYSSGATESGVTVGDVTVEFKAITGWDTPSNESATITEDDNTPVSATYVRQTGSLTVTIEPQGARDAGAQWRRTGTSTWFNSGATESAIPTGEVTVEFKDVVGYDPAANQSATITDGGNTAVSATYPPATGSLSVTISPSGAADAGARWRRTGTSTWYNSGATESGIAVGDVTMEFLDVGGWDTPSDQSVTISEGATASSSGTYVRQTGALTVTIDPVEAAAAGGKWRRTGTSTWFDDGATESGIPTGEVTVEFRDAAGWTTPSNQNATVTNGGNATLTGTYAANPLVMTVSSAEGYPGGSVQITISLNEGSGVRAFGFDLEFDSEKLEYAPSATKGALVPAGFAFNSNLVGGDTVRIGAYSGSESTLNAGSGVLATITFNVLEDAEAGTTPLTLIVLTDDIALASIVNGGVEIQECVDNYDVNDDGQVTPGDALMAFKHYLEISIITDPCALKRADANNDGYITPGDALIIFKEYLGLN